MLDTLFSVWKKCINKSWTNLAPSVSSHMISTKQWPSSSGIHTCPYHTSSFWCHLSVYRPPWECLDLAWLVLSDFPYRLQVCKEPEVLTDFRSVRKVFQASWCFWGGQYIFIDVKMYSSVSFIKLERCNEFTRPRANLKHEVDLFFHSKNKVHPAPSHRKTWALFKCRLLHNNETFIKKEFLCHTKINFYIKPFSKLFTSKQNA